MTFLREKKDPEVKDVVRTWLPVAFPFLSAGAVFGAVYIGFAVTREPRLLSVDPSPKFVCSARQGDLITAMFRVTNPRKEPIKILGASTSCSCTVVDGLPVSLPPGNFGMIRLRIKVGVPDNAGKFVTSTQLFTNCVGTSQPLVTEVTVPPISSHP
jgi:hypothetical protein